MAKKPVNETVNSANGKYENAMPLIFRRLKRWKLLLALSKAMRK